METKLDKCYEEIEMLYQENEKLKELLKEYKEEVDFKNGIIDCAVEELKVLRKEVIKYKKMSEEFEGIITTIPMQKKLYMNIHKCLEQTKTDLNKQK
jgi:cell division septum initiation protein DivIVA